MRRLTSFILLLSACAVSEPWPAHYLSTGIDHATQDEVIAQLGPPDETRSLSDGSMEWHYHHQRGRAMVGAHGTMGGSSSLECEEYILRFDHAGVLRAWDQHLEPTCEPHSGRSPFHEPATRG